MCNTFQKDKTNTWDDSDVTDEEKLAKKEDRDTDDQNTDDENDKMKGAKKFAEKTSSVLSDSPMLEMEQETALDSVATKR